MKLPTSLTLSIILSFFSHLAYAEEDGKLEIAEQDNNVTFYEGEPLSTQPVFEYEEPKPNENDKSFDLPTGEYAADQMIEYLKSHYAAQESGEEAFLLAQDAGLFNIIAWQDVWDGFNEATTATPPDRRTFGVAKRSTSDAPTAGGQLQGGQWTTFTITAKSYIAKIGNAVGKFDGFLAQWAANALVRLTDLSFSENPTTVAMIKDYRLFSTTEMAVNCQNSKLLGWTRNNILTDTGKEPAKAGVQAPKGWLASISFVQNTPASLDVKWVFLGRPPVVFEAAFNAIQKRSSVFIWHEVNATITCQGNAATLALFPTGSGFPSHRFWVNAKPAKTIAQGPFRFLWNPRLPGSNVVR